MHHLAVWLLQVTGLFSNSHNSVERSAHRLSLLGLLSHFLISEGASLRIATLTCLVPCAHFLFGDYADPHSIVPAPPEALNRTVVPLLNDRVQRVVSAS